MSSTSLLALDISEHHKDGAQDLPEENMDTLEVVTFQNSTTHNVPKTVHIGLLAKEIIDKSPVFKPVLTYIKGDKKYRIAPKSATRRTLDLISLFKSDQEKAIAMVENLDGPLVMTRELMDVIQQTESHFFAPVARLLDSNFQNFFRFQIQPPYLAEMYYPLEFLLIKHEEDTYRSNVSAHGTHHGLTKIESSYLNRYPKVKQTLRPMISCNPNHLQRYNPDQIDNLISKFISIAKSAFPTIPVNQMVIAGGAIAGLFHDRFNPINQDIDVFVIGDIDKEQFLKSVSNTTVKGGEGYIFNENIVGKKIYGEVIETGYGLATSDIKVQLVKRRYNSISEILHGFDVDSSCIGVECHTRDIYVSKRFDYAFRNNFNTVDLDRLSPSYESRLLKYSRRGWAVFIPGISQTQDYNLSDERSGTWDELNRSIKGILLPSGNSYNALSVRQIWSCSSGLTRLAMLNAIGRDIKVKYTSDYYWGKLYTEASLEPIVFGKWMTENPGRQHTSSFNPLANDKSWYDSSIQELTKLKSVNNQVTSKGGKDYFQIYNLLELRDGSYISILFKNSINQPTTPSKYYYRVNTIIESDLIENPNRLMSMTVYDSESSKYVGTLSGVHAGKILPFIIYTGKTNFPHIPDVKLIRTEDEEIYFFSDKMKELAGEGQFFTEGHIDQYIFQEPDQEEEGEGDEDY